MAATRLIALHINKGKTIAQCLRDRTDYAQNPEKTEKGELVSGYECDPMTADEEFGSVKNFVALVKNGSFLVRITDMTILIEKEFIYGSSKRPNPTDYYRKQHYQCG